MVDGLAAMCVGYPKVGGDCLTILCFGRVAACCLVGDAGNGFISAKARTLLADAIGVDAATTFGWAGTIVGRVVSITTLSGHFWSELMRMALPWTLGAPFSREEVPFGKYHGARINSASSAGPTTAKYRPSGTSVTPRSASVSVTAALREPTVMQRVRFQKTSQFRA
jgi:hypothetical protein